MSLSSLFKRFFHPQPAQTPDEEVISASGPSLSNLLLFPYREIPKSDNAGLLDLWQSSHKEGIHPLFIAGDEQTLEALTSNRWECDELPDLNDFFEAARIDLETDEFSHTIIGNQGDSGEAMDALECPSLESGAPLLLGEIPAEHPWDIFRLLPIGGWNDCPSAEIITSFCKRMYEDYGAEPVMISGDMLFMKPNRMPFKEESYELALKLYAFCPDMVSQGAGSIHALADSLTKSPLWQFWWD